MYIALKSKIWWQEAILPMRSGRDVVMEKDVNEQFQFWLPSWPCDRQTLQCWDTECSLKERHVLSLQEVSLSFEIDVHLQIAVNLKDVEPTLVNENSDIIDFIFDESAAMLIVLWKPRACVIHVDVLYSLVTQCLSLDSRSFSLRAE